MKYGRLHVARDALSRLSTLSFAPKTQIKVARLWAWAESHIEDMDVVRQSLIEEHAERDENGRMVMVDTSYKLANPQEFQADMNSLMNCDIFDFPEELRLDEPDIEAIRGNGNISAGDLASLGELFIPNVLYESRADNLMRQVKAKKPSE